jgi:tetratricopeptide (TPR) repeat protein
MRLVGFLIICCITGVAQSAQKNAPPRSDQSGASASSQSGASRSDESSSSSTKIDLSPPKGDDIEHADSDVEDDNSGVMETKPWNPHKAAKDVEVGDFYFKRKNYGAAISRYREALLYKPKDAISTFRLAQALEASKQNDEALQRYQEYLKILPNGEFAAESEKGIARLKAAQKAP